MTKDEIKTLIAEKISGQGNQVDIGGALAKILNELVDAGGDIPKYAINEDWQNRQPFNFSSIKLDDDFWAGVDLGQFVLLEVNGKVRTIVPYLPNSVKTQLAGMITSDPSMSKNNIEHTFGGYFGDDISDGTALWVVVYWEGGRYLFDVDI